MQVPVYKPAPIGIIKWVMLGFILPNSDILFSVAQEGALERADFIKFTQELVDTADTVVLKPDRLSNACDSCHNVYRDKH